MRSRFFQIEKTKTNSGTESCPIPLTCARSGHSARPFLGTSGIRAPVVRAGPSAARKPSMTGAASPRATPLCCQSRTPQPIADSLSAFLWAATVVSQGRLGSGSKILASSLEETTRTSAQERPVGRTRWPRALTTWRHPPSIRRARAQSTPLRLLSACSESSYPKAYSDNKQKASASYSLSTVQEIQQDMMQCSSVTGAFTVYEGFATMAFDIACVIAYVRVRTFLLQLVPKWPQSALCGTSREKLTVSGDNND